jgi:predicted Zn-dependent protease
VADPDARVTAAVRALRVTGGHVSVRVLEQSAQRLAMVRGVPAPIALERDRGAMITVALDGPPAGIGYAASADLSAAGLQQALDRAQAWARAAQRWGVFEGVTLPQPARTGLRFEAPCVQPLPARGALWALLAAESDAMKCDARIVDWQASLGLGEATQWFWWDGTLVAEQRHRYVTPNLEATAADDSGSQTRSLGGQFNGFCQQGGFEVIERSGLIGGGARVAADALALLAAPNCPSGRMDLVLAPDQMMLQIHESIGHPLELDRILGDERNFAGTSFVTPDMFGHYQYGSALLNVASDPGIAHELAAYAADDDGHAAQRVRLIEHGRLVRPLGSALSQARAAAAGFAFEGGLDGVANARACGWHRPAIDRMPNLNVEPGTSSFDALIGAVERGVLMRTNVSWSIDDSRNKFQFGCEWGRMIEDGRLTHVVRNPNYRGVSATFWRSLAGVGDASTFEVMGTPFCGKGEPGQVIHVGHAAPACLFRDVDVFGAAR